MEGTLSLPQAGMTKNLKPVIPAQAGTQRTMCAARQRRAIPTCAHRRQLRDRGKEGISSS